MNNLEWAINNKPWIFNSFNCAECVKSRDGKHCTLSYDEIDETECAKGNGAWLMQPHESSPEPPQTGDCEKDECEPAESENAAPMYVDSREKLLTDLETHVRKWREYDGNFMRVYSTVAYAQVKKLLDRQASITCAERDRHWMEIVGANANANVELKRQIDELQERSCPGYEPESHRCKWHDADFELNADRLNDLKRENARLEQQVDELEETARRVNEADSRWEYMRRDLEFMTAERDYWRGLYKQSQENAVETHDLAEDPQKSPEQQHICDTCRWFEPEKWVKTGKNTESFQHAQCHHGPGSFATDADSWCGEWSK